MAPKPKKPSAASIRRAEEAQKIADAKAAEEARRVAETNAANAAAMAEAARNQRERTDWIEQLNIIFRDYGLESLAPKITEFVQQGFSKDTVTLKLQDTAEYQQRFAGNTARKKAGLPVLGPKDYLATEQSYRQIMRSAGLPQGFYDNPDDFSTFIGFDVSPSELKERVDIADLFVNNIESYYTDSLTKFYGLNKGDLISYVLDPERSLPLITRQAQAAQFGGEAARQGLDITKPLAEQYAAMGVSRQQARTGFEQVAQIVPVAEKLSQMTAGAQPFGVAEATTAVFGGDQSAEQKRRLQKLAQTEQSRFAGQAGVGQPSLGMSRQGQF